ncbi:MAG: hypothetical protein AB1424_18615 [Thermodesulfobacteriota bacterium]
MKRLAIPVVALVLLLGLSIGAAAQESALGKAVAALFGDRQQVKHASYAAWRLARDEGPRVAMEKSFAHLKKATASAEVIPAQAAPDAFAAWWYNIAAQYWSEIAAKHPGGEAFVKAVEGIAMARQDLEKALGWDAEISQPAFREAYRIMQGYK